MILTAADTSSEHLPAMSEGRAGRQREIVQALCAGEPPSQTAARLGISIHHYYRERRSIGNLVSRKLLEQASSQPKRFEVVDPLRLLCTHAATLRDQGRAGASVSILETALSNASDEHIRLALESEMARSLASLGRVDLAAKLLDDSNNLAHLQKARSSQEEWVYNHYVLTRTLLAMENAHGIDVGTSLETLARSHIKSAQADEEALDAIIQCGDWYCQTGMFDKGRKMLDYARELGRQITYIPARLQSALALLAAHCAQRACDEFDLEYHLTSEALALSVLNGSVRGILGATAGLMQYCASGGRDEWAYDLAQEGLRIARDTEGSQLLSQFALQVAGALLWTRYWRALDPLIFEVEKLHHPKSLNWAYLKEFQGVFLMRVGQYDCAETTLQEAQGLAKDVGSPWLEGMALRDLACTQHRSGSADAASELMKAALALLVGRCGIASLGVTYEAASSVLADRRLARLADQIKVGLLVRARRLRLPLEHGVEHRAKAPLADVPQPVPTARRALSLSSDGIRFFRSAGRKGLSR